MLVEQVAEEVLLVVELVALKARAGPGRKKRVVTTNMW